MCRTTFRGSCALALAGLILLAGSGGAVDQPVQAPKGDAAAPTVDAAAEASRLRKLLAQTTKTPTAGFFGQGDLLKDVLDTIMRINGVMVRIDGNAFRLEGMDEAIEEKQLTRRYTPTRGLTLHQVLAQVLGQIETPAGVSCTYLVKGGHIVVVPKSYAQEHMLSAELVSLEADRRALADVLREISDQTGATILLDQKRAALKAETPITAVVQQAPLQNAVRLLADMAGLRAVLMGNALYVTTPENASVLLEDGTVTPIMPAGQASAGA